MVIKAETKRVYTHHCTLRGVQWYVSLGLNPSSYDWFVQPDVIRHGVSEFWRSKETEIVRVTFASNPTDTVRGILLRDIRNIYTDKLLYVQTYHSQQSDYTFYRLLESLK